MTALPAHDMGPTANAFRKEVRDWLARNWTAEKRAAHRNKPFKDRGWDAEFSRTMGRDGWIGVGWPKKFGGQARSPTEQIVFVTELANAGVPYHAHNTSKSIVAPSLFAYGTPQQQDEWIPKIRAANATSRWVTASLRPAPTSRRSAPARCATATIGSSTARSSGPPAPTSRSTCGSRCAPIRRPRSTPASAC